MTTPLPYKSPFTRPMDRREILRAGTLGLFGLQLPTLLAGQQVYADRAIKSAESTFGRAKACILLFMWGGPAHQDTWDLKPDAPVEVRGEFKPIATRVPGIQICEHFPQLAQRTDRLAIIRSLTHTDVNHTTATSYLLTGQPPAQGAELRNDWPHMGGVLARLGRGREPLPPFVQMRPKLHNDVPRFVEESHGQTAGWLGPTYDPMTIDSDPSRADYHVGDFTLQAEISASRLADRQALLKGVDQQRKHFADGSPKVMSDHYRRAFDLLD